MPNFGNPKSGFIAGLFAFRLQMVFYQCFARSKLLKKNGCHFVPFSLILTQQHHTVQEQTVFAPLNSSKTKTNNIGGTDEV